MPTPNDMAKRPMSQNEVRKSLGMKSLDTADKVKTKSVATIAPVEDDSKYGPHGGFTAVLSSPRLDRDGDIWPQDEWIMPLPKRITVDADHGMSVSTTIGSAVPYFDTAGNLLIDASFSSIGRAQEVRTLIREGHVSSVSVAALTDKSKKDGTQKRELLNAGVVAIPANPDAIILDSKSTKAEGITVKVTPVLDTDALNAVLTTIKAATPGGGADHALLQAIHDASVHMGANCADCQVCAATEIANQQMAGDPTGTTDGANKSVDSEDIDEKSFTLEEFRQVMLEVLHPEPTVETSADETESPADDAAAASDEEPAPADDAADEVEPVAVDAEPGLSADHMLMLLDAASNYSL